MEDNYEEQFINILLNHADMVKEWLNGPIANTKFFNESYAHILQAVRWANTEDVILTRNSFKAFIETFLQSPADVLSQLTIFNRCHMRLTKKDDMPMLRNRISQTYTTKKSAEFLRQYTVDRTSKSEIEANNLLANRLLSLEHDAKASKTIYLDLAESKEKFLKDLDERRKNPARRLTCGIAEIDDTMSVGFAKGTLTIFCAAPGTFKTTIMMNVALNIFKRSNENILFLPLEGPHELTMQKIVSRETEIPFYKIEHAEHLTDSEILQIGNEFDKWATLTPRFKLMKISDRTKLSTIKVEIEKRISFFEPRVVFFDYIDNIVPERKESRNDLELRSMFEDMIKLAENYGFAAVTAAKLSRQSLQRMREETKDGGHGLDTTDVHGGQEFGGNATNLYGQVRNGKEPNAKLDFYCMKARFGQNVFANGKLKSMLTVNPQIGLIKSPEDVGFSSVDSAAVDSATAMPPPEDNPY